MKNSIKLNAVNEKQALEQYQFAVENFNKVTSELKEAYSHELYNATWEEVSAMEQQQWLDVCLTMVEDEKYKVAFDTKEVAYNQYKRIRGK